MFIWVAVLVGIMLTVALIATFLILKQNFGTNDNLDQEKGTDAENLEESNHFEPDVKGSKSFIRNQIIIYTITFFIAAALMIWILVNL